MPADHLVTGPEIVRKGRGKSRESLELIQAAYDFLSVQNPTTVRGVCYALFTRGLIPSMERKHTAKVSRQLTDARELGMVPWEWLVDESREIEGAATWRDPDQYVEVVRRSYRRDAWAQQPVRLLLVSEKGTVRGTVRPVTDQYGVQFLSVGGYSGASTVHQLAESDDGRELLILYVGDHDPSGLHMSEVDLPGRLARYGGAHITVERIALLPEDLHALPSFPASDKSKDSRYSWFVEHYGTRCWELDAMPATDLRARVEERILREIEPVAWDRCMAAQEAEQQSLKNLLDNWRAA